MYFKHKQGPSFETVMKQNKKCVSQCHISLLTLHHLYKQHYTRLFVQGIQGLYGGWCNPFARHKCNVFNLMSSFEMFSVKTTVLPPSLPFHSFQGPEYVPTIHSISTLPLSGVSMSHFSNQWPFTILCAFY